MVSIQSFRHSATVRGWTTHGPMRMAQLLQVVQRPDRWWWSRRRAIVPDGDRAVTLPALSGPGSVNAACPPAKAKRLLLGSAALGRRPLLQAAARYGGGINPQACTIAERHRRAVDAAGVLHG